MRLLITFISLCSAAVITSACERWDHTNIPLYSEFNSTEEQPEMGPRRSPSQQPFSSNYTIPNFRDDIIDLSNYPVQQSPRIPHPETEVVQPNFEHSNVTSAFDTGARQPSNRPLSQVPRFEYKNQPKIDPFVQAPSKDMEMRTAPVPGSAFVREPSSLQNSGKFAERPSPGVQPYFPNKFTQPSKTYAPPPNFYRSMPPPSGTTENTGRFAPPPGVIPGSPPGMISPPPGRGGPGGRVGFKPTGPSGGAAGNGDPLPFALPFDYNADDPFESMGIDTNTSHKGPPPIRY